MAMAVDRGEVAAAAGGGDLEHLPIRAAHFRSDSIRLLFQKTPKWICKYYIKSSTISVPNYRSFNIYTNLTTYFIQKIVQT